MTRRIAITILLTVCTAIFAAGATAWVATWFILLRNLDQRVLDTAKTYVGENIVTPGDRSVRRTSDPNPAVVARHFRDGYRVLWLKDGRIVELPSDEFFNTMIALGVSLASCGLLAGALSAIAARRIARVALRPLNHTAETIGEIDESRLDRRIDAAALPVELRPMAGRLNEMLERLGRAFEQRRRFLADASHELRTPVAAIITTMEVALRRPRPVTELVETMETCLSEARHMRQLVQALLRQVRAEGSTQEEPENVDAGEMLRECADLAGSLAAEKQIKVVRSVRGIIPVRAEPGRLRSVVLNLMSNAIEYNRPGGTVELSAQSDPDLTEIVVKDDGPGISPEHLPHLFQPFYRATRSREADGHLGLGLFLVNSHVKAMGGECRVESSLGFGTTFRIRLPSIPSPPNGNGGN